MLRKIVVIGPESTGKSTLSQQLAAHFDTVWCPEYAREYLATHGREYNYETLLTIARGQIALEDQTALSARRNLLFIDTDLYVMKVWSEFVFGRCDPWILTQIARRSYDLYLLCNIDLPWAPDELREYPDPEPRRRLYKIYRDLLIHQNTPWAEISGKYEERLGTAVEAVHKLLLT